MGETVLENGRVRTTQRDQCDPIHIVHSWCIAIVHHVHHTCIHFHQFGRVRAVGKLCHRRKGVRDHGLL